MITHKSEGKPNCYKCIYRGIVPGDAHSCCKHPKSGSDDSLGGLMAIFASVQRVQPVTSTIGVVALGIKGNPHGIRSGWFNWPWNFDPTWLEACDGFTPKKEVK